MRLALALSLKKRGSAINNGIAITATTPSTITVSAAPGGRTGYRIERTSGGGAWDAAANSATSAPDNALLRIKFGSGDYVVGLTNNPTANNSYTSPVGFAVLSNVLYVYSSGSQVGAARGAPTAYGFVHFNDATDEVKVYTAADDVFATATLIDTIAGANWAATSFDCSLNTANANFEALFDVA